VSVLLIKIGISINQFNASQLEQALPMICHSKISTAPLSAPSRLLAVLIAYEPKSPNVPPNHFQTSTALSVLNPSDPFVC